MAQCRTAERTVIKSQRSFVNGPGSRVQWIYFALSHQCTKQYCLIFPSNSAGDIPGGWKQEQGLNKKVY